MNSKKFWAVVQAGVVAFWLSIPAFLLGGITLPLVFIIGAILLALHTLEIPVALIKLRGKGVSVPTTVAKTLVFGFTWWLPLSKGITQS